MHKTFAMLKGFRIYNFIFECEDNSFKTKINGDNDSLGYGEGDDDGDGRMMVTSYGFCGTESSSYFLSFEDDNA